MTRQREAPPSPTTNPTAPTDPLDNAKTVEIRRADVLSSTVVLQPQTTLTLDTRALGANAPAPLPFQPGPTPAIATPDVSAMPPRPGEFTGTVALSVAQVLQGQTALPFDQAKPIVPSPAPSELPDVFRAHLAGASATPAPPARTIGEVVAAGGFAFPPPSPAAQVMVRPEQPLLSPTLETPQEAIVLLYLHRPSMQRIARKPAWQPILDALEEQPLDPEADDPALSADPAEIQEQTQVYAILKQGRITDREGATLALEKAANKPGRFAPPVDLFEGELEPSLDNLAELRAWMAIVPAVVSGDERLQSALTAATSFLDSPAASYAPPFVRRHIADIRDAFAAGKHARRLDEIEYLVVRSLLEQRQYQKRNVLGGEHLRALLHCFGQTEPSVVYVPLEAASFLPLQPRFRMRMVAEIHFAQDEQETQLLAWRCLALSSVTRRILR